MITTIDSGRGQPVESLQLRCWNPSNARTHADAHMLSADRELRRRMPRGSEDNSVQEVVRFVRASRTGLVELRPPIGSVLSLEFVVQNNR